MPRLAVAVRLFAREWVPGWAAPFAAVLFVWGVQLVAVGIVGEYVGRIYAGVKRRPLYLLHERLGSEEPQAERPRPVAGRHAARSADRTRPAPGPAVPA